MVKATQSGNFTPIVLPEPQTTVARCYSLIDIGTVPHIYQNQNMGTIHRIFLTWELPKLKAVFNEEKGEQPFVISEEFTLSTKDNSNLAKLIAAWRNKPFTAEEEKEFDPTVLVGKTCVIQFIHKRKAAYKGKEVSEVTNENTNLRIQAIMKRPKDMEMPAQVNPSFIWDWEPIEEGREEFSLEKWELIPNFLKDKIKTSEEFQKYGAKYFNADNTPSTSATQAPTGGQGTVSNDEW